MRVKTSVLGCVLTAVLAAPTLADPLEELRAALPDLRAAPGTRLKVDVAFAHQGVAPLHWSGAVRRGQATVVLGKRGAHVRRERWVGTEGRASVWGEGGESDTHLLEPETAGDLIDPAGALLVMLDGATLLEEKETERDGAPVRQITFRPGHLASDGARHPAPPADGRLPVGLAATVWVDASGVPIAMERSFTLRLGPALDLVTHQMVSYQRVDGHLFAVEASEDYTGSALFVLRGRDARRMWVTSVE
jgi:hypothetical protein